MSTSTIDAGPDYPTREEFALWMQDREAKRTLQSSLAFCRRMEREHPERAHAWRQQAHSFTANNPERPKKRARR